MIRTEVHDDILHVWLAKGRGNALEPVFLSTITDAVETAAQDPPRGLILTAEGSAFCAGLDLVELESYDRQAMQSVLDQLARLLVSLITFPRPVVAAINGHAIAGGALTTLAADRRLLAQGDAKWGLTEMVLGLPMPASTLPVLKYALRRPVLETLVYGGAVFGAEQVLEMGVVDALVDSDQLLPEARRAVVEWTTSPEVFADIKRRLHAPTLLAVEAARESDGAWLDFWFSELTQSRVAEMRARLQKKRGK